MRTNVNKYVLGIILSIGGIHATSSRVLYYKMLHRLNNLPYVIGAATPPTIFAGSWYGERQVNAEYKAMKLAEPSIYDKKTQEAHKRDIARLRFKRTLLRSIRNVSGAITIFGGGALIMARGMASLVGL